MLVRHIVLKRCDCQIFCGSALLLLVRYNAFKVCLLVRYNMLGGGGG